MPITANLRNGIAFAIISVILTVSVFAQTTASPDSTTPVADTGPAANTGTSTTTPAIPTVPPAGAAMGMPTGMPGAMQPGTMPFGATQPGMPGALPPSAMSGMPADPMMGMQPNTMGMMDPMMQANPMGRMPMDPSMPMTPGMRQGPYMGYDPEMNAMLARQLQDLRMQDAQLATEIFMSGGKTSPAVQPLLTRRAMLQNQIRSIETQLGISSAGTTAAPGTMGATQPNPMGGMPMGMQPGMPGYPADLMTQQRMAAQGLPPGMGADPYSGMASMGAGSNRMLLTAQRQEAVTELQYVQRTLPFLGTNDPQRAIIVAQQEDLTARIAAIDKQLEQIQTPVAPTSNTAGSMSPSLTDSITRQPAPRPNVVTSPEIAQMQYAADQMRLTRPDIADDMQRQIEQRKMQGFVEPQLPPGMSLTPDMLSPNLTASILPTTVPMSQQAELTELRNTVNSLRSEITSLREEIRALNAILYQWNQPPSVNSLNPTPTVNGFDQIPAVNPLDQPPTTNEWYDVPAPSQPETDDELPVLPAYTLE